MNKPLRLDYDKIPLLPHMIAEMVCEREYAGLEWSARFRTSSKIAEIEELRKKMTYEDRQKFAAYADRRCRIAYEQEAEWFMKLLRSRSNRHLAGTLYAFITHWMVAWLKNPRLAQTVEDVEEEVA